MRIIRNYWRLIFPIAIMIVIWIFSSQNGENSDNTSMSLANFFKISNGLMRKIAHLSIFAILTYSWTSFFKNRHKYSFPKFKFLIYPLIFSVVYAIIDECHQMFSFNRTASVSDVIIDTLGVIIGILVYIVIFCFWRLLNIRLHKRTYKYDD